MAWLYLGPSTSWNGLPWIGALDNLHQIRGHAYLERRIVRRF
jgi:hypothetical protein